VGLNIKGVSYSKMEVSPVNIWALDIPQTIVGEPFIGVYLFNQIQTILLEMV
jgi:hypothetical protein